MIALDTSALMAVVLQEAEWADCAAALVATPARIISAVTLSEALIVAGRRSVDSQMDAVLSALAPTVITATDLVARRAAQAYSKWGKGVHPARLNFADCFAYVTAQDHACALLYVGRDFSHTDVRAALPVGLALKR